CARSNGRDPVITPRQARLAEAVGVPLAKANDAFNDKNYTLALLHLNKALSIDPRNEAVLHRRGHAHFESGSYDRAVADYTAAVAVSKNKEHLYIDRAKAYLAGRKNELAIADYGRA